MKWPNVVLLLRNNGTWTANSLLYKIVTASGASSEVSYSPRMWTYYFIALWSLSLFQPDSRLNNQGKHKEYYSCSWFYVFKTTFTLDIHLMGSLLDT